MVNIEKIINSMNIESKESEDSFSDYLRTILNSPEFKNLVPKNPEENSDQVKKESLDAFRIRQLEQKTQLLVGLTTLLFKKFEEIHPTQKYTKFEFSDLSWYKKLATV
ncbi:MAG: hypothetical protein OEL77_05685 [Nitrosopumilus sp.]|nr:hypothetical protein [Nitrosopumilus sp.]MDH3385486.1 hypothetical protein [Nitrosopumilus sp.]